MAQGVERDPVTGVETMGHEWDGIKELNNPLPRWWLYVLWTTVAVAVVMWVLLPSWPYGRGYFAGLLGYSQRAQVMEAMAAARAAQAGLRDRIAAAETTAILQDPELLAFALEGGRVAFADNCQPCHGQGGAGQAGGYPALVDDDWLWGGSLAAIEQTLRYGIRSGHDEARLSEMPPFGDMLTREQIDALAGDVAAWADRPAGASLPERSAQLFAENCSACHGESGAGVRELGAPALHDRLWLFGHTALEIARQIRQPRHGVMPAWGERLPPDVIKMLTVYVHALGGGEADAAAAAAPAAGQPQG